MKKDLWKGQMIGEGSAVLPVPRKTRSRSGRVIGWL